MGKKMNVNEGQVAKKKERTSLKPSAQVLTDTCGLSDQQESSQDFFNSTLPPVPITLRLCLPYNADFMTLQQSLSRPPPPTRPWTTDTVGII